MSELRTYIYCSKCKQDKEIRNRRWCNKCYSDLMAKYRAEGRAKTSYDTCCKCGCSMNNRKHPYCKKCLYEYGKNRKEYKKKSREETNKVFNEISKFVNRVVKDDYNIELLDINIIIEYYSMITPRINEFDNMPSGSQVYHMFHYIKKWVEKSSLKLNI